MSNWIKRIYNLITKTDAERAEIWLYERRQKFKALRNDSHCYACAQPVPEEWTIIELEGPREVAKLRMHFEDSDEAIEYWLREKLK